MCSLTVDGTACSQGRSTVFSRRPLLAHPQLRTWLADGPEGRYRIFRQRPRSDLAFPPDRGRRSDHSGVTTGRPRLEQISRRRPLQCSEDHGSLHRSTDGPIVYKWSRTHQPGCRRLRMGQGNFVWIKKKKGPRPKSGRCPLAPITTPQGASLNLKGFSHLSRSLGRHETTTAPAAERKKLTTKTGSCEDAGWACTTSAR